MHFVTIIIIPCNIYKNGNVAIKEYVNVMMEPYDENTKISPYIALTKEQIEQLYQKYNEESLHVKYDITEFVKEYLGYDMDNYGNATSVHNKDCFYDWYVIGGRWSGSLYNDYNLGREDSKDQTEINCIKVKKFLNIYHDNKQKYLYNVIIDKDGKLHKNFEISETYAELYTTDEWKLKYESILENAIGNYIIILDCHN